MYHKTFGNMLYSMKHVIVMYGFINGSVMTQPVIK